jgi:altronate hydrolase
MALHPNVGAYVLIGLGCEVNQIADLVSVIASRAAATQSPAQSNEIASSAYGLLATTSAMLAIQDLGGTRKTIEAGIQAVEELLPQVNAIQRTPQLISELMIGMECGGSDSWSGVTANPLVGLVGDEIVRQGGSIVVSETTEIYGAEHLLTRRAINEEVGRKLIDQVKWWEDFTQRLGTEIDNNPSPGNKAGGLTTIYEKALGAIAKGGRTDHDARLYLHGFARQRSRFGHRRSGEWLQSGIVHHRAWIGLRVQARAVDQDCDEHAHVRTHERRHGLQRRAHPRR